MIRGMVKWYNPEKGYGFITPDNGEKDVFVHISQFEKIGVMIPKEGMRVEFVLYNDRGRIAAGKLKIITD